VRFPGVSQHVHCPGTPARKKVRADLVIAGGIVVTMDADRRILEDGAVAVKGDQIVGIGKRAEIEAKYTAATHIDASGHLVLPGFINGHTHVPMTLLRASKTTSPSTSGSKITSFPPKLRTLPRNLSAGARASPPQK